MASITKRGSNSYRISVSTGYDSNGKKLRKEKTVRLDSKLTPKQVEKELNKIATEFELEVERGLYLDSDKITFSQFIDDWLDKYGKEQLAPKTLHRYEELIESRIRPSLGHLKIQRIQPRHILEFCDSLKKDGVRSDGKEGGLSDRTILHHFRLVSSILTTAVHWQVILSNPCERLKPPKVEKKEARHYNQHEVNRLLEALENAPLKYKVIINLAIYTGLREGELMGLFWDNIDFDKCIIEVNKSSQYIPNKGVFTKSPKTYTSNRLISVPKSMIVLLREYRIWQNKERLKCGDLWEENNMLFTQWNGKPMHTYTPTRWLPKFIKKFNESIEKDETVPKNKKKDLQLPLINFHGLRHTNATLLIAGGTNIKTISARLGHSNTSTTLNIYSHSLRSADEEAADKLESILSVKENSSSYIA